MARREAKKQRAARERRSGKRAARNGHRRASIGESDATQIMAKNAISVECTENEEERRTERWILEGTPVLIAKDFLDSENPDSKPIAALKGRASRDVEELVRQIHLCCSDQKWTSYQKRVACEQLVQLAVLSTSGIYRLAKQFPEPFREIAEELSDFPCFFPAHAEDLPVLKNFIWDELSLGKRHTLKFRAASRRKTFSKKTWVNALLLNLIDSVYRLAHEEHERDPGYDYGLDTFRDVVFRVPLTPQHAKKWFDLMWKVLLVTIPNPEKHPRLRQLVERPSLRKKRLRRDGTVGEKTLAHNMRAEIRRKLGIYLKRMLNDSAVHK